MHNVENHSIHIKSLRIDIPHYTAGQMNVAINLSQIDDNRAQTKAFLPKFYRQIDTESGTRYAISHQSTKQFATAV